MIRYLLSAFLLLVPLAASSGNKAPDDALRTLSEQSGFTQTGRYAEVEGLCSAFAEHYPDAVRCIRFGTTPQGRPMLALAASRSGQLEPKADGVPVVLVQGGIHAGEIDGKDAGFLLLRELLEGRYGNDILQRQVILFVPVFNIDGHERFGAWNRPNQNGPEEMGWRTTAQNLNLNRDYLKAETPEMRAMLELVAQWDPLIYIDLHVTDGAKFRHDVSIQIEPLHAGDDKLAEIGKSLSDIMLSDLRKRGSLPLSFYPSFDEYDNPASGFTDGVAAPRFSHGYLWLRNRFGILVETHSWKPYKQRVAITHDAVLSLLRQISAHGDAWQREARAADRRASELAGKPVTLTWKADDSIRQIDFLGYAYTRTPSAISGALMTRYDDRHPQVWKLPLRDHLIPDLTITAPSAGYLVPVEMAAKVRPALEAHGIRFQPLEHSYGSIEADVFRADNATPAAPSFEGHQRMQLSGAWHPEKVEAATGALWVPIDQPRARLIMSLLEPTPPDSLAAWGWFNNAFERKEYMEPYVAEEVAEKMLSGDSKLAAEFSKKLEDPKFAQDPSARLDFFYRRHPSYDDRLNRYPVYRLNRAPTSLSPSPASAH